MLTSNLVLWNRLLSLRLSISFLKSLPSYGYSELLNQTLCGKISRANLKARCWLKQLMLFVVANVEKLLSWFKLKSSSITSEEILWYFKKQLGIKDECKICNSVFVRACVCVWERARVCACDIKRWVRGRHLNSKLAQTFWSLIVQQPSVLNFKINLVRLSLQAFELLMPSNVKTPLQFHFQNWKFIFLT